VNTWKNLTEEPPRSPRTRLGGYALVARMADKGRATLHGVAGEYHFACPLDQRLFDFKGVQADDVKSRSGAPPSRPISRLNTPSRKNGLPRHAPSLASSPRIRRFSTILKRTTW